MRAFLEQYGIAIFTIIILGIMVLMVNGVGLTIEDLLKQEIDKFTSVAGTESDKVLSGKNENSDEKNEYGFYYDEYVSNVTLYMDNKTIETEIKYCLKFNNNGTITVNYKLSESDYNNNKELYDNGYHVSTYEDLVASLEQSTKAENERMDKTTITYDYLIVKTSYSGMENSYYFSDDGTKFYWDAGRTEIGGTLIE